MKYYSSLKTNVMVQEQKDGVYNARQS